MAERETAIEDGCQRTRGVVGLAPDHAPDLDPRTINVVGLAQNHGQNHGPDPGKGKGGKTTHDRNSRLSLPETRWSHGQKTRRDAGPDPARERDGKKKGHHHPGVLRKLQGPVFCPLKTQNSHRTRRKIKISLEAPSKRKIVLW